MGRYDIPAFVDKILEVTGKPKVTLMGYSQGGAQIFYALATDQDWYADRVHRFVGLAPCHYYREVYSFENQRLRFLKLNELGLHNYFGRDESSVTMENCVQIAGPECDLVSINGFGLPVNSLMYFTQIALAGQFQESISLERWAAGELYSTPVNLSNIDRVPVSIVHPIQDEICDTTMIEWTYAQMQQQEKYLRFEHGGHLKFALASNDGYVQRMVETIEYGTVLGLANSL